jgi:hypothetical protein
MMPEKSAGDHAGDGVLRSPPCAGTLVSPPDTELASHAPVIEAPCQSNRPAPRSLVHATHRGIDSAQR